MQGCPSCNNRGVRAAYSQAGGSRAAAATAACAAPQALHAARPAGAPQRAAEPAPAAHVGAGRRVGRAPHLQLCSQGRLRHQRRGLQVPALGGRQLLHGVVQATRVAWGCAAGIAAGCGAGQAAAAAGGATLQGCSGSTRLAAPPARLQVALPARPHPPAAVLRVQRHLCGLHPAPGAAGPDHARLPRVAGGAGHGVWPAGGSASPPQIL